MVDGHFNGWECSRSYPPVVQTIGGAETGGLQRERTVQKGVTSCVDLSFHWSSSMAALCHLQAVSFGTGQQLRAQDHSGASPNGPSGQAYSTCPRGKISHMKIQHSAAPQLFIRPSKPCWRTILTSQFPSEKGTQLKTGRLLHESSYSC